MGEALLRSHIQALRQRLAILPEPVRIQRLVLEDNVVEFKVLPEGSTLSDGKRLNFLIYEADAYPHSGGVLMSEDERDEAMMEAMNGRIRDPDKVSVSDALVAACSELGVQDPALFACLSCSSSEVSAASSVARQDASPVDHDETDLCFEGEDDNGDNLDYIGHVEDRESRPGWKKMKWQETEEQRILRRQEQLRRSETEPGQKRRKGGGGEMTLEEQKAADQQMWSSQEAFTILCNELFQLQTEGIDTFEADAVDYDVHQWNVRIRGAGGALGEDLQQLQKMFGYDYIELRLCFKEDLHPFYPPTVSVVRPRLQGKHDVLAALACHPRLQLRGWSPFQASKDLLVSIRHFLEKIARVDLANEQNDIARFSGGAFSELERQLAQLGNLCEIVPMDLRLEQDDNPYKVDPWAQDKMLTQTSLGAMLSRKKSQQDVSDKQKSPSFWAAGTGYGHDHHRAGIRREGRSGQDTWDPQAMAAAQVAQDAELKGLVRSISSSLQAASARSSSRSPSSSADRQDSSAAAQLGSCTTWKTLADLLLKSCLAWFLVRELSISYTNMGDRLSFFEEVFQLVQELLRALPEHAAQILAPAQPHLVATKNAAMTFLQTLGKSNLDRVDLEADVAFARLAVKTADDVEKLGPSAYPLPGAPGPAVASADSGSGTCTAGGASSSSAAPTNSVDREEAEYIEHMRERQFDMCDFGERHAYATTADRETTTPQARTVRLAKELAGLAPLLPLSGSSSVFVRVDSRRQQLWRVLVTGPDDTPYSNGCFMFDIYFPPMYPNEPPTVQLVTNGNNSVTFNPNLYASGKVCLSLLGTWKGEKAESWDPANSRTLQVLVSIQSLILVPEPYFNEPGYEREIGTKQGEMRSRDYSQPVREGCVRWGMLDHLKNSLNVQENKIVRFPEFQEVLQLHFQMRAQKMQETLAEWIAEAKQHASSVHAISLKRLLEQLAPQLALLQGVELGALEPTDALPVDAEEAPADGSEDARPLDADGMWEDGNESMPPG